jgi:hypothetical protein
VIDVSRDLERMRDYLSGRLCDEDHQAFEDRLSKEPELVRELELTLRMREGLEQLRTGGQLEVRARRVQPRPTLWAAGLAAAVLGTVGLGLWAQSTTRPAPILTASASPSQAGARNLVVAQLTFMTLRGASTPVLDLPTGGMIELRVAPSAPSPGARYSLTLERLGAGTESAIGTVAGLAPGADGFLSAYADASRLQPGSYELRLVSESASGTPAGTFPFSLRAVQP